MTQQIINTHIYQLGTFERYLILGGIISYSTVIIYKTANNYLTEKIRLAQITRSINMLLPILTQYFNLFNNAGHQPFAAANMNANAQPLGNVQHGANNW